MEQNNNMFEKTKQRLKTADNGIDWQCSNDSINENNVDDGDDDDDDDDADHFAGPHASEGEKRPPGPRVHSPCSRSRGIWKVVSIMN